MFQIRWDLHIEGKVHFFIEVTNEYVCKISDERGHSHIFMLLLFDQTGAGNTPRHRLDHLRRTLPIFIIVL